MPQTILITGASRGLGAAFAETFARRGCRLILTAKNNAGLLSLQSSLKKKFRTDVHTIAADLALPDAAEHLVGDIREKGLPVDILINNAGMGVCGHFSRDAWPDHQRLLDLNITAPVRLTRLLLPQMIARKQGRILNVASVLAFLPAPFMSTYAASKAFLLSFSLALSGELKGTGVTVTALCPGPIQTDFDFSPTMKKPEHQRRRGAPTDKIAEYGYGALMRGRRLAVPGFKNKILTNLSRVLPMDLTAALMFKHQKNKIET